MELSYKGQVLQKQEAKPKKSRDGAVYNDVLLFDVDTSSSCTLENFSVTLTAYNRDFLRNNDVIGYVRLSDDATNESERKHWKSIKASPVKAIAEWHKLHRVP